MVATPRPDSGAGAQAGSQAPKKVPAKKVAPRAKAPASRSRSATAPVTQNVTLESVLAGIKQHESGGNYTAKNPGSTASGAYQYLDSTWNNYGGYKHAKDAPPAVQDARARADVAANYKKYGDWRKVVAAHFAGSGWVDKHPDVNAWDQNPAPGSNNPTVARYVASVFANAGMSSDSTGAVSLGAAVRATPASTPKPAVTSASPADTLPANASAKQVNDYVASHYGYLAAFLQDKEIGPILRQAAVEDWSDLRRDAAIQGTTWWKTHSDATRTWDARNKLDPAMARSQVEQTAASITAQAKQAGLTLDGKQTHDMAVNALRFGWNSAQITEGIKAQAKLDPAVKGTALSKLKAEASDWLVPVSDQALEKWSLDIATGKVSADDYTTYLQSQAKSLFPSLAGSIDRGVTVKQYVDPYKQYASQLLEINPDSIDFVNDPKFSKALFNTDPKTGERTQMSLSDWQRYLRGTSDYTKTAQATDAAAQFATMLTNTFGKVA